MMNRRTQPQIHLNCNQSENQKEGHMFAQGYFEKSKEEKKVGDNGTDFYENFYASKEENEKIIDEEEQLKSKFLYNKTFVNNNE